MAADPAGAAAASEQPQVLLIFVMVMFALLCWASPNAKHRFRWISPGAAVAVAGWLVASGLFALFITNFGHYHTALPAAPRDHGRAVPIRRAHVVAGHEKGQPEPGCPSHTQPR